MKTINLEELLENFEDGYSKISIQDAKTTMEIFAKQLLELAAENAKVIYIPEEGCATGDYYDIDKSSILDTIKQIKLI